REAPAFAFVRKRATSLERREVVHEPDLGLPRELDERALPLGDAFAEVRRLQRLELDDLAGVDLHLAKAGASHEAGALIEVTVANDQPLREGVAIVRVGVDDAVAVDAGGPGPALRREEGQRDGDRSGGHDGNS